MESNNTIKPSSQCEQCMESNKTIKPSSQCEQVVEMNQSVRVIGHFQLYLRYIMVVVFICRGNHKIMFYNLLTHYLTHMNHKIPKQTTISRTTTIKS